MTDEQKDDLGVIEVLTNTLSRVEKEYVDKYAKFKKGERVFHSTREREVQDVFFDMGFKEKSKIIYYLSCEAKMTIRAMESDIEKVEGEDDGKE